MIWWYVYNFNRRINSRDFRVLFLYEWKSNHNAAAAAQNFNAAFISGYVNERTILNGYIKFETGDESLRNKDRGRPERVVDNEILGEIVKK